VEEETSDLADFSVYAFRGSPSYGAKGHSNDIFYL
jgi:hypothetical protein